jgi:hypothetical protein
MRDDLCGVVYWSSREDWLAYMKLTDKTSKIISYRANRFNNLFSGAETVIDHRDDILSLYC